MMIHRATAFALILCLPVLACVGAESPAAPSEQVELTQTPPAAVAPGAVEADPTNADGSRLFGAELSELTPIALTALLDAPADYDGQIVQTEGTISSVCQRMGCWMELRPDEGGAAIRVPMAGHSFFLPRDVSGSRATIEGTVEVQELPEDWQEHLREEGAQAADQSLAISATGVLIHAG